LGNVYSLLPIFATGKGTPISGATPETTRETRVPPHVLPRGCVCAISFIVSSAQIFIYFIRV
jgi:hypothetical protein